MLPAMHRGTIERYVLDQAGKPVPEPDLLTWGLWMEEGGRQLAVDEIGDYRVSTVFLGIDHQFGDGPPVLWESMIFGPEDLESDETLGQRRYTSRDAALQGHAEMVAALHQQLAAELPRNGLRGGEAGDQPDRPASEKQDDPPPGR